MMKKTLLGIGICLALAPLPYGCSRVNVPDETFNSQDREAISAIMTTDPLFTNDDAILNDGDAVTSGLYKTSTPIYPRAWGRKIDRNSIARNVTYDHVNDTTVIATMTSTYSGTIIIRAKYSPQDSSYATITKPFTESTTRKVKFYRRNSMLGAMPTIFHGWYPVEATAAVGGTQSSLVDINQVQVMFGSDTVTVSDPLNYWFKFPGFRGREIPVLPTAFSQKITVRVTVTSSDPDTDIVSVHRPWIFLGPGSFRTLNSRMTMISQMQSGNSYIRVYEHSWTGLFPGRHNVFVGALTRSSIFDDQASFSSRLWGVPYIVQ